jgi:hypothetical protein
LSTSFDIETGQGAASAQDACGGKRAASASAAFAAANDLKRLSSGAALYMQTPRRMERVHGDHDDPLVGD